MTKVIATPCGAMQGTHCDLPGVSAYKGIRFATAGRWEYPKKVTAWEGVYDATQYGPCCYQPRTFFDEARNPSQAFYYHEFREGDHYTYSEDCLFLNVFTPEDAAPNAQLPVIVYIHGGGFTGGCGHEKPFDGPVWATKGVVAVTIQYRLGVLGFACLPELTQEAGHCGNYGLYDQLVALEWIQDNIAAFGGDPDNVTLMGQSAGAMSVQALCLSPLADGLFHKAVMCSGGGVSPMMNNTETAEMRYPIWQKVMEQTGCADLAAFRALDPAKLYQAWAEVQKTNKGAGMANGPCMDGVFVVEDNLSAAKHGRQKDIPCLIGSTSEDMMPLFMYEISHDWCVLQADQHRKPAYCWFFDRQLPGDDKGAWHSSDLWYWFGTLDHCWRPFTDKDRALSEQMVQYLVQFARTGDPNGEGLPRWEPTNRKEDPVLHLGEGETRMDQVSKERLMETTRAMMKASPMG